MLYLYLTFSEMKYTSSLKRNNLFRKSTSNILEFANKFTHLESLLQVYFKVSK